MDLVDKILLAETNNKDYVLYNVNLSDEEKVAMYNELKKQLI